MNNNYFDYFKYVLEHKKNVFNECIKMSKQYKGKTKRDLIIHAFTHDLSKFSPKEFIPYARYDFKNKENNTTKTKEDFNKAWQHHKDKNKHHWNYWHERGLEMPHKYILQMICDWSAMSVKFGGNAQEFYLKNYDNIKLDRDSRLCVEYNLDLHFKQCCECDLIHWQTVKEIINEDIEYKAIHG